MARTVEVTVRGSAEPESYLFTLTVHGASSVERVALEIQRGLDRQALQGRWRTTRFLARRHKRRL